MLSGDIFYFACIDEPEKLLPFYERYAKAHHYFYHRDIYSNEQWLEIMPKNASKANAILQLKEPLGCGRLVVFGDGVNDLDMFRVADEAYAVENAVPELKAAATAVIGSNDEDGVAKWLRTNCKIAPADQSAGAIPFLSCALTHKKSLDRRYIVIYDFAGRRFLWKASCTPRGRL